MASRVHAASTLSVAGLTPITASPAPSSRPSSVEAATPRGSSVGWLGCRRTERWPGRPIVLRKRVTTWHLAATAIRSCRRISLLTAAAISGVMPGRSAASVSGSAASRNSRNSPTVSVATGANATVSWVSTISRVTSSVSYATTGSARMVVSGTSASAICAATRSAAECRGETGQRIAGAERRRARQQRAKVVEDVACAGERVRVGHVGFRQAFCAATTYAKARAMRRRTIPVRGIAPLPRRRGRRTVRCRHAW